jgi:hypothetical protein
MRTELRPRRGSGWGFLGSVDHEESCSYNPEQASHGTPPGFDVPLQGCVGHGDREWYVMRRLAQVAARELLSSRGRPCLRVEVSSCVPPVSGGANWRLSFFREVIFGPSR